MNSKRIYGLLATAAVGATMLVAPATAQASQTPTTGSIKICQHGGDGARLRVYAEGNTGRSAELREGRCVQWSGIRAGSYEIGYDSIGGYHDEDNCYPYRVTVHRPGSLRATSWMPVFTSVQKGQATAVGVYMAGGC